MPVYVRWETLMQNSNDSSGHMDPESVLAREDVIRHCIRMNEGGINQGTSGNISVRHHDGLLISPTSMPYQDVEPEDVVFIDKNGKAHGRREPSTEWLFHYDILMSRQDVNAVVHAHPTYSTILAVLGKQIPPFHYMIFVSGGNNIRCSPYALYGTKKLSELAVAALEGRKACLLGHHGMIAIGSSLKQSLWRAIEVETLARQYHGCLQLGEEPQLLSEKQVEEVLRKTGEYGL